MFRVYTTTTRQYTDRFGQSFRQLHTTIGRQPSWVTRVALMAGAFVLAGVVLLIVIPAIIVAAAVFLLLATLHALKVRIAGLFGGGRDIDRRRNVRVIVRRSD